MYHKRLRTVACDEELPVSWEVGAALLGVSSMPVMQNARMGAHYVYVHIRVCVFLRMRAAVSHVHVAVY